MRHPSGRRGLSLVGLLETGAAELSSSVNLTVPRQNAVTTRRYPGFCLCGMCPRLVATVRPTSDWSSLRVDDLQMLLMCCRCAYGCLHPWVTKGGRHLQQVCPWIDSSAVGRHRNCVFGGVCQSCTGRSLRLHSVNTKCAYIDAFGRYPIKFRSLCELCFTPVAVPPFGSPSSEVD